MSDEHIDDVSGVSTTGHEWDGIRELNNPLPRWWVITFYITIVWAIGYTIAYPAWPMLSSATKGVLGYSSRNEVKNELAAADAAKDKYVAAVQSKSVSEILANDTLREFAVAAGGAAFKVNCTQCHGSGAAGSKGFPNLNDDDWLWGGKPDQIQQTITHGIRFVPDADTRVSEMPAFAEVLTAEQIAQVSTFVASLSGSVENSALIAPGAKVFAESCAACHGDNAKGNREVGAPDLTDAIWLYGSGESAIAAQVRAPRQGVMPAWGARLGETKVKELAVYIHSLGGGE
ncbi:cytochrome-c oxidase, cbb3-type subunit III [Mesorhizobium sp. B2-3-13]|uniref:cytochrome-c oxidase, cbb3-type subunit III n=1 Tax=unclassified Mesorhizobium TaxID=325217 RepID=UPI001128DE75|nr:MULTISPECIES: cytochrome-c oxidase, cbb3-type subunit III [unclassified Mesorhizobium]TPJ38800.1 cytochrome-c oxidase, cbb3-type subunit III [Mesorhizobium sp. B2-6-5]TPJ79522.1 cytochrome-c oxidase, cbb3-type subunit III [Mesorhizobium sp. B2-5-13]TPK46341.1 cytochrome-c oxidase, cbb3-type subunit III [Mesorhizobium sp. B2-5-5]TPL78506.1 cytochrome-c oxidase, cbb3-type subunit III [Mesorhizobium sp. B2-3-13]